MYLICFFPIKTQNVIITNPSSTPISYSLELVSNYENKKNRKKGSLINNNQVFEIAKVCYRI